MQQTFLNCANPRRTNLRQDLPARRPIRTRLE